MIPVIDWHCDVLLKLQKNPEYSFFDNPNLDVNYKKLKAGGVKVQAFAIFIDPQVENKYECALKQISLFHLKVLSVPNMVHIRNFKEIHKLDDQEIGAFLTLEGLDCVGDDLDKVNHLLDEGVLSVGITWNNGNLACDGIEEPKGAGLTPFGYQVVDLCNQRACYVDVSHISELGFIDVLNHANNVIASHSNVRDLCNHKRNLSASQIQLMKEKNALYHLVYYDRFVSNSVPCTIDDLLGHFDYLIEAQLTNQLGLGSDFDGIDSKIQGLEDASHTQSLIDALIDRYGEVVASKIAHQNFMNRI